ncbi:MAG: sulfotransferase [Proteobacteria bacterium]|nr:sulfotransferase [Pseudomonadota bacterium]
MQKEILFVLADVRSGSTLLAQLLGAHPDVFSVGEIQWLRAYARDDRSLYNPPHELACACGETFAACDFWQSVAARLQRPVRDAFFVPRVFSWIGPGAVRQGPYGRLWMRLLRTIPSAWLWPGVRQLSGGRGIAENNLAVFDAIFETTGARYIVDSSKNAFRFRSIYDKRPGGCRIIVLNRDYRAAVHSRMKRGVTLDEAAEKWAEKVRQVRALTRGIPDDVLLPVKYEDICGDPRRELTRICEFLGLEFRERMLRRPTQSIHDLGGSPSKLEAGRREIRLDTSYVGKYSDAELERLRRIVGPSARIAGYGVD